MNDKSSKRSDPNLAIIKKLPSRKAYSTPHLVCYGDLNELTQVIGGNDPPNTDIFWGIPSGSIFTT